ncbi:MAG: LCP family protein [Negativicutes bacterium]|nr:LCP family protein [Negativicutes bacterium]
MRSRREGRGRRKIRWDRVFLVLFFVLAIVASLAGAAMYAYYNAFRTVAGEPAATISEKSAEVLTKRINVLLIGIDDGEDPKVPSRRADTLMLASINPESGTINLLSLPRDTRVSIPGHKGLDKISHAYAYGGVDLTVETVKRFLGVPIHYYMAIDWRGFIEVIDILGGVDLYVENNMDYEDPYANLEIHLKKGYQHLDGEKAGQYVRFRHDELGDIGRVQRQQRFLKALANEMMQMGTIIKLPAIASTLRQYVDTDMNTLAMLKVANSLKTFQTGALRAEMLPGNFATIDGLSYWVPDKEQTKKLVESMFTSSVRNVSSVNTTETLTN